MTATKSALFSTFCDKQKLEIKTIAKEKISVRIIKFLIAKKKRLIQALNKYYLVLI